MELGPGGVCIAPLFAYLQIVTLLTLEQYHVPHHVAITHSNPVVGSLGLWAGI